MEVQRAPLKTKRAARGSAKVTISRRSMSAKPMTPKEKKFVKGLSRAFKDMDDHIAGRKKLKTLKEVLDEL